MNEETSPQFRLLRSLSDNLIALGVLVTASFLLLHTLPGNQADALLISDIGSEISHQDYARVEARLGLDQPLLIQFGNWLGGILQGDMGYSELHAAPIFDVLMGALPWTLGLVLLSLPLSLFTGAATGLLAGIKPEKKSSRIILGMMTLLSSLPGFVVALLLLSLFAFTLGWFPTGGGVSLMTRLSGQVNLLDLIHHALLPLFALSFHGSVRYFYLAYGLAQQISQRPFIRYAQLRGVHGARLLWRWYLPNAMPELLSRLSSSLPGIVGASLFIEVVFSYPGTGSLMLDAINNRDYPLLQGALLLTGALVLMGNTLLDLLTTILTERG
jgi:peptide/nickel transport system permease protein